jgi:plastocyanin
MAARRANLVVALATVLVFGPPLAGRATGAEADDPQASRTGTIRGRVDIRRTSGSATSRPDAASIGASTVARGAERRPAVVFLETAPRGAFDFERDDIRARMDQRNETFVPHVLAITVGTTVDFPNSDPVFHNVFSLSKTRPFDLGRYPAGRSKSVRFDRPGVVQVFCEIHSHMSAYILVFGHRYFAVTGDDGAYRIDRVPPGTYTLVLWHEGNTRESRAITVTGGDAADADFVVR